MTRFRGLRIGCVWAAIGIVACDSPADAPDPVTLRSEGIEAVVADGVRFISMRITPPDAMEALFEGRVVADEHGCLRLESADPATVVWPRGYRTDGEVVRDADGDRVGRLGDGFRLGGGEVPYLHEGLGFEPADQELAAAQCPGRFWIASVVGS